YDMNAVARVAVLAAAAAVLAGCGSDAKAVDTSSQSYQEGLKSGTSGLAEIEAFKGMSNNKACELGLNIDSGGSRVNKQDYMAGCLYGLSHQSAQWNQMRKK